MANEPLFLGGPTGGGEGVARVAGETAGEVAAVVHVAGQADLVAPGDLRDAPRRQQERDRQPEPLGRHAGHGGEPRRVVVVQECHEEVGARVQPIATQRLGQGDAGARPEKTAVAA